MKRARGVCSVPACGLPHKARGFCAKHGQRARLAGELVPLDRSPMDRFMAFVSPEPTTGCWLWAGGYAPQGYGSFSLDGAGRRAHQVAWELFRGPRPAGLFVRHVRCANRACVNPDHLELGDAAENMADTVRDGHATTGHRQPRSVLTEAMVGEARRRVRSGEQISSVARSICVGERTLASAVAGRTWAWLTSPEPVRRAS